MSEMGWDVDGILNGSSQLWTPVGFNKTQDILGAEKKGADSLAFTLDSAGKRK